MNRIIPVTLFLVMLFNTFFMYQPNKDTNLLILALNNFAHRRPLTNDTFMNTLSKLFTRTKLCKFRIICVLMNSYKHCSKCPLDALSFYVNDAGCVLASTIARRPCSGSDRGQSLIFHKFMQSWVGYELLKVLVTFELQPNALNDSLKTWLPDLHDVFSYMLTNKMK
jgi:hypothetical protein